MKMVRVWAVLVLVSLLGACVWAPGQHMNTRGMAHEGSDQASAYQLIPITPKLIAMDRASAPAVTLPPALLSAAPQPYVIGPGDSLYITVWDHPELTSPAGPQQQPSANGRLVSPDGSLFYPYAGVIQAGGRTLQQLRDELTHKLAKYVENPQVDVNVIAYGSQRVTLRGAFLKTEPQPITVVPLTLAQAIGAAGINTEQANLSDLVLTRDGHDYHLDLDALNRAPQGPGHIWLRAGDAIYLGFNDRQQAYVMGEVTRPQAITFKTDNLSLTQALGQAGGLSQTTSKGKAVYVIRGVENMEKAPATIYQLDASSPAAFALAANFDVHPGDVVFVGAAGITRWNRFLSQLLPLSGLISNAASANNNFSK